MPNHYHLQIKQLVNNGISVFISKFQNSFTKFFNTLINRSGHLFESQFKAKIILNEEEFIHINRYIHLNPYTSFLIKNIEDLKNYFASSLPEYLDEKQGFCEKSLVLSHFKNLNDYWQFIRNQADYQRKLNQIKHLTFE
jgi:putative transposase